jgi:hypothetical protein
MSITNELRYVHKFLYDTLRNSTAVQALCGNPARVYESLAPEGAVTPFIIFAFMSAHDVNTVGAGSRSFTEPIYKIVAVDQDDGADRVGQVADAIEAAVTGLQNVTTESITIMGITRTQPVMVVEELNGKRFSTVGGLYRLFVSKFS